MKNFLLTVALLVTLTFTSLAGDKDKDRKHSSPPADKPARRLHTPAAVEVAEEVKNDCGEKCLIFNWQAQKDNYSAHGHLAKDNSKVLGISLHVKFSDSPDPVQYGWGTLEESGDHELPNVEYWKRLAQQKAAEYQLIGKKITASSKIFRFVAEAKNIKGTRTTVTYLFTDKHGVYRLIKKEDWAGSAPEKDKEIVIGNINNASQDDSGEEDVTKYFALDYREGKFHIPEDIQEEIEK